MSCWQKVRGVGRLPNAGSGVGTEQVRVRGDSDEGIVYLNVSTTQTIALDPKAARYLAECLIEAVKDAEA